MEAVGLYWVVYWESALLTEPMAQWGHSVVDSSCRSVGGAAVPGARRANIMRQIFPLPPPGASYTELAGGLGLGDTRRGMLVRAQAAEGSRSQTMSLDSGHWKEILDFTCKP